MAYMNNTVFYARRQDHTAWRLYLEENWLQDGAAPDDPRQHRHKLMKRWKEESQELRDEYQSRSQSMSFPERDTHDYLCEYTPDDFRRKLNNYPCLRPASVSAPDLTWSKLSLFLKLDDMLQTLCEDELPCILELPEEEEQQNLTYDLRLFTQRHILDEANFTVMGMTAGPEPKPVVYYHIVMLIDQQTVSDGTLLHVDFDCEGRPAERARFRALDSYTPWTMHLDDGLELSIIQEELATRNGGFNEIDMTQSTLSILTAEMEARNLQEDPSTFEILATEAILSINPALLTV